MQQEFVKYLGGKRRNLTPHVVGTHQSVPHSLHQLCFLSLLLEDLYNSIISEGFWEVGEE